MNSMFRPWCARPIDLHWAIVFGKTQFALNGHSRVGRDFFHQLANQSKEVIEPAFEVGERRLRKTLIGPVAASRRSSDRRRFAHPAAIRNFKLPQILSIFTASR
jgi:hypothetical protein